MSTTVTEGVMAEIIEYLLEEPPVPIPPAERTRQWREQMRVVGRPDTKAIDAAISEAASLLMSIAKTAPVLIDAETLVRVARIVLVRQGYNRKLALALVIERLKPRARHDQLEKMPSRVLTGRDQGIEPPRGGQWKPEDVALIRQLTAKTA